MSTHTVLADRLRYLRHMLIYGHGKVDVKREGGEGEEMESEAAAAAAAATVDDSSAPPALTPCGKIVWQTNRQ